MSKYVISDPKNETYLNNIHLDILGSRMVGVNMVSKQCQTILTFSSKDDAQGVADRINKKSKEKVLVLELS